MPETPQQGEIWRVRLDPGVGAEMGKTRPCVIISSPMIGRLPLCIIVPITDWKESYASYSWMTRLDPTAENGLSKPSAADGFQVRSVSPLRFTEKRGEINRDILMEIEATVRVSIEVL
jgi:mRNA interferase MazF